jgi:hypothetical protein
MSTSANGSSLPPHLGQSCFSIGFSSAILKLPALLHQEVNCLSESIGALRDDGPCSHHESMSSVVHDLTLAIEIVFDEVETFGVGHFVVLAGSAECSQASAFSGGKYPTRMIAPRFVSSPYAHVPLS